MGSFRPCERRGTESRLCRKGIDSIRLRRWTLGGRLLLKPPWARSERRPTRAAGCSSRCAHADGVGVDSTLHSARCGTWVRVRPSDVCWTCAAVRRALAHIFSRGVGRWGSARSSTGPLFCLIGAKEGAREDVQLDGCCCHKNGPKRHRQHRTCYARSRRIHSPRDCNINGGN